VAFGEGDLTAPDRVAVAGLADAEAEGLGARDGVGSTDGTTMTSGDGVGAGFEVTLSLSQTK
jgi:hypothetical protein